MAEFNPGLDDDFDPNADNPDSLPSDPDLSVTVHPIANPTGNGFTVVLPVPNAAQLAQGVPGTAVQVLSFDPTRACAQLVATSTTAGATVMFANDPSQMINGAGATWPMALVCQVGAMVEVWAACPAGATTPVTLGVWVEQIA